MGMYVSPLKFKPKYQYFDLPYVYLHAVLDIRLYMHTVLKFTVHKTLDFL